MKILIVSTIKRKVDKNSTAARSRIIYELAKGLAEKGHNVFLLGTADSKIPKVKIIPVIKTGWINFPPVENKYFLEVSLPLQVLKKIIEIHNQFDIIHNHLFPEFLTPIIEPQLKKPMLTTIHIEASKLIDEIFGLFTQSYFVSISYAQNQLFKKTKIFAVVHNGVDTNFYSYKEKKEDYLLWLGRLNSAKNPDGSYMDPKGVRWAIRLAKETGEKLILSGAVHDIKAFEADVKPYLSKKIQWVGKISPEAPLKRKEVVKLIQNAKAFLMTVNWEEPFGLVMAEAGSCGTPVIGFDRGAVPEIVVNGKTGFVVPYQEGVKGLKKALKHLNEINPYECRAHIENYFSVEKMVENYLKVYQKILNIYYR